mmetsp:Transcript_26809/g.32488  ORF Transcript_26809/g.32488 Transcript_26809/m.32488 type:complete len:276 (-) Transcript_26809:306-1133(-)
MIALYTRASTIVIIIGRKLEFVVAFIRITKSTNNLLRRKRKRSNIQNQKREIEPQKRRMNRLRNLLIQNLLHIRRHHRHIPQPQRKRLQQRHKIRRRLGLRSQILLHTLLTLHRIPHHPLLIRTYRRRATTEQLNRQLPSEALHGTVHDVTIEFNQMPHRVGVRIRQREMKRDETLIIGFVNPVTVRAREDFQNVVRYTKRAGVVKREFAAIVAHGRGTRSGEEGGDTRAQVVLGDHGEVEGGAAFVVGDGGGCGVGFDEVFEDVVARSPGAGNV